jgi:hypothetical protein
MNENFGGWAIDVECYNKIVEILPKGKTILEFGSGTGTAELVKNYIVHSVEHDINWVNKYGSNYIYAPLKPIINALDVNWYDVFALKQKLPEKYDLILIDGPPSTADNRRSREGFYWNLNLFNLDGVIIIFDDIQREHDFNNMILVSKKLGRTYEIFESGEGSLKKKFGVLMP